MARRWCTALQLAVVCAAASCAATFRSAETPLAQTDFAPVAEHVLVIGCDGLGSMYMVDDFGKYPNASMPNLKRLQERGAYTYFARTNFPSVSKPNWCGILGGGTPNDMGVLDNDWTWAVNGGEPSRAASPESAGFKLGGPLQEEQEPWNNNQWESVAGFGEHWETMFSKVDEAYGANSSLVFTSWYNLVDCITDGAAHRVHRPFTENATEFVGDFLAAAMPNSVPAFRLMMIHMDDGDKYGHGFGWGSPEYLAGLERLDEGIGALIDGLERAGILDTTTIVLSSDHGGKEHTTHHNRHVNEVAYIPWLVSGAGVKQGVLLPCSTRGYRCFDSERGMRIKNEDVAPTALRALGIAAPAYWQARVVEEAFEDAVQPSTTSEAVSALGRDRQSPFTPRRRLWDFPLPSTSGEQPAAPAPALTQAEPGFGSAKRVIVLGVKGLGSYFLSDSFDRSADAWRPLPLPETPWLDKLREAGSWTWLARSQIVWSVDRFRSWPLTNWCGMFLGSECEENGVVRDTWPSNSTLEPISGGGVDGRFPGLFDVLAGLQQAANDSTVEGAPLVASAWNSLQQCLPPLDGPASEPRRASWHQESFRDSPTQQVQSFMKRAFPSAGKSAGVGAPQPATRRFASLVLEVASQAVMGDNVGALIRDIEAVDAALGELLHLLSDNDMWNDTLVVFAGDSGAATGNVRHEEMRGTIRAQQYAPMVFMGPGIRKGMEIPCPTVGHSCFAPTAAASARQEAVGDGTTAGRVASGSTTTSHAPPVRNIDLAPTVAHALGADLAGVRRLWTARLLTEIFDEVETRLPTRFERPPKKASSIFGPVFGLSVAGGLVFIGLGLALVHGCQSDGGATSTTAAAKRTVAPAASSRQHSSRSGTVRGRGRPAGGDERRQPLLEGDAV